MSSSRAERKGIGILGAGFLADTRARCWLQCDGVEVVAVCSRTNDRARDWAKRHAVPVVHEDLEAMLADERVHCVDLCVPNSEHSALAVAAAEAGKDVICTKPLTAYVGQDLSATASDGEISGRAPEVMLEVALAEAQLMVDAALKNGVQLLYGENWIYAPSYRKALRLLERSGGAVLEMRGGESHQGSHSPYSKLWRNTGGGALLRLGSHPIGAMLHLKRAEGLRRLGRAVKPVAVTAEVADLSKTLGLEPEVTHVATGWQDVENWGSVVIAFDDGSRGIAWGSDNRLGGMESRLELMASNCNLRLNLSPSDMVEAYSPAPEVFEGEYIMEKIDSGAGWTTPMPDEDWTSGQLGMCQAFAADLVAGRRAESDGTLGLEVVRVIYAAYHSAASGRRVELSG